MHVISCNSLTLTKVHLHILEVIYIFLKSNEQILDPAVEKCLQVIRNINVQAEKLK